ncbi:DUF6074 family protein [Mesorhizobium qingshengii]|uniref:Uncharacterized protein n=1 Tax=Mesorhizobium qingshengii TaxID=1165689 RepID=A0A1G5V2Z5_9HYPH|nr:DUF6074 family protein [Mesorhizobium qingshengii]SDA40242.1 hypothetical protein SAMN02927914_00218 [Mesorhizobium qingshengii]
MKGEQMEFVLASPTTAEIIPFPGDPLAALVRRTARELEHIQGPAADRLWRERCRGIQQDLAAIGIAGAEVQAKVDKFALDVHGEMQRLAWSDWHEAHQPGGDAA